MSPDYTMEHREAISRVIQQIHEAVDQQAREIIGRKIQAVRDLKGGQFFAIMDDALEKLFPKARFFGLRFRQFPVAREVPDPFKTNNLFVVLADGSALNVTETKDLQSFFQDHATIDDADKAKVAMQAWLRLNEDLNNDGFFRFTIPENTIRVQRQGVKMTATGQAVVANVGGGNRGAITATLTFEQGQLLAVEQDVKLREGPRPICQSTKLLDADPIVRQWPNSASSRWGTAPANISMSSGPRPRPSCAAIDRIWERIVREER